MRNEKEGRPQSAYPQSTGGGSMDYVEPVQNPYLGYEGETRQDKDARMKRVRKMLATEREKTTGVKNQKVLDSFERGKSGR
jgi:hypothetical protein